MGKKPFILILILLFSLFTVWCDTAYDEGVKLLKADKPEEARLKLEDALVRDNRNEMLYLSLALAYQQLGNPAKAIDILQRGLLLGGPNKCLMYYNIGNSYFKSGDKILAEKNYTLCIAENSLFPEAYLNRANARMDLIHYKDAVADYKTYLRLRPDAPQRPKIEQLIALLEQGLADQENLLQNVLNSLKNASLDAETTSAGIEGFKDTGTTDVDIMD